MGGREPWYPSDTGFQGTPVFSNEGPPTAAVPDANVPTQDTQSLSSQQVTSNTPNQFLPPEAQGTASNAGNSVHHNPAFIAGISIACALTAVAAVTCVQRIRRHQAQKRTSVPLQDAAEPGDLYDPSLYTASGSANTFDNSSVAARTTTWVRRCVAPTVPIGTCVRSVLRSEAARRVRTWR